MNFSKTYLPLFKGIDLTQRRLPMMVARTNQPGPVIWLTAAIHGDEVTGIAVIQSVFKRLEQSPLLKGSLYAFPILNPMGFEMISRAEPFDDEDLNRSFGDFDDSPAQRHASIIGRAITETKPDLVVDLHTDSNNSIPYTIIDDYQEPAYTDSLNKCIDLAKELSFPWALDSKESAGYDLKYSLSGYLVTQQITAVTLEIGGPMVVNEEYRKQGLEAIWGLLHRRGMVQQAANFFPQTKQLEQYYFIARVKAQNTGIIDYRVYPGQKVKKGKILGKIRNVFGETIEVIRSPITCQVFSHEDQSVVFPGQSVFTLASKVPRRD